MNYIKAKDRAIKLNAFIKGLKAANLSVSYVGEYNKWKELDAAGSRISVKATLWEIHSPDTDTTTWFLSDTLDRVMCYINTDKQDILNWLSEHGYKTDKQFHLDNGMTEEAWEEWNKGF